ncbi:MAG: PAS domain S-box protein [Candidatus Hydrothermarchaeales archaeon]
MKNNREANRQTKEELEKILNTIQEGICVIDKDLIIRNFNDAFAKNIILPKEEIIGKKCYKVLHGYSFEDYQKYCIDRCIVKQAFKKKAVESVHRHIQKDGSSLYHESKALPLKNGDQVVYIINDVTERMQMEKALLKSEKKYRSFFDHDITGDLISTPEGQLIDCNPAFLQILGFASLEEAKSVELESLYPTPVERQEMVARIEREKKIINYEHEMRKVDGETIFVNQNAIGEFDDHNKLIKMRGYIIDITERKQFEEALRESEEKYRGLINNSVVGVYQTTMDGNILTSNPKLLKIFGFSSEEELKQTNPKSLYKDEKRRKELLKILEGKGEVNNFELDARRKDGEIVILNISAKVYDNHEGKLRYIEGIIQDVTEQKRLERKLMDYTAKLEHSNKFKDLFTDILRHDLLNPINIIQNLAELIEDTDDFYEIQEDLRMMKKNIWKLQEMIETAATLSKVESVDKLKFKRQELGIFIAEAIENVEAYAKDKNIKIENKIKGQHTAYVSLLVDAVFTNLLTNAIKYSPKKTKIIVNIVDHKDNWKVTIKDFGDGVPDEYKESIFSRFMRMEKKGVRGSGLGLAIVKRIVDLHDGRVWVEDNPKKGSIFCVDLPKEPTTEKRLGKEYSIESVKIE